MKLTWIVFAVMVAAQWLAPVSLIRKHEQVLAQGETVKFKCGAPDPFDPLRGRYLTVRVEDAHAKLPDPSPFKGGETVYATIVVGADGFATFDTAYPTPPASGLYLKCKLPGYVYDAPRVLMEVPIERYYVNEEVAPKADEWLAKVRTERGGVTWVEVRILNGSAVITDIKHDGKSVNDVIRDAR